MIDLKELSDQVCQRLSEEGHHATRLSTHAYAMFTRARLIPNTQWHSLVFMCNGYRAPILIDSRLSMSEELVQDIADRIITEVKRD